MTFYYTARSIFNKNFVNSGMSWDKYIEWSRLPQLTELISVDGMLNKVLFEPDRNNADEWNYIVTDDHYETGFFTTLDYVLMKAGNVKEFNLLAVVIEPAQDCKAITVDQFVFLGYDLLDKEYSISALSNCGGFDESFLPGELNQFGLVDEYDKAYDIKRKLLENNPQEHHAYTNVIALWRHEKIGRTT